MEQIQPIEPDEQIPVWDYTIRLGPFGNLSGGDEPQLPLPGPLELRLRITYRERQDSWYLDIFEPVADTLGGLEGVELDQDRPIMTGFRLTSSIINAMLDYKIPELPNQQFFFALDIDGTGSDPGFEALGRSHALIHADFFSFVVTGVTLAAELGALDQIQIEDLTDQPSSIVILP